MIGAALGVFSLLVTAQPSVDLIPYSANVQVGHVCNAMIVEVTKRGMMDCAEGFICDTTLNRHDVSAADKSIRPSDDTRLRRLPFLYICQIYRESSNLSISWF